MTAADELAEALAGPEPDFDAEPAPVDRERTNYLLHRLAALEEEIATYQFDADEEHQKITERLAELVGPVENKRRWILDCLELTARALFAHDKTPTHKFMAGDLLIRSQQPKWEFPTDVPDEWADDDTLRGLLVPSVRIDKNAAKKVLRPAGDVEDGPVGAVTEDGLVVPGVTVSHQEPRFQAVLARPKDRAAGLMEDEG